MSTKKRSFKEVNDDANLPININEPSQKKQKIAAKSANITSKLFENQYDQCQFQKLYKSITASSLVKSMDISSDLIQELAEFATGRLKQCSNKECKDRISVLRQDKELYDETHNYASKLKYKICQHTKQIYCGECMNKTMLTTCYCMGTSLEPIMRLELISNNSKCMECGTYFPGYDCCCWRPCDGENCFDKCGNYCIQCVTQNFHYCYYCDYGGGEAICGKCTICQRCREERDLSDSDRNNLYFDSYE